MQDMWLSNATESCIKPQLHPMAPSSYPNSKPKIKRVRLTGCYLEEPTQEAIWRVLWVSDQLHPEAWERNQSFDLESHWVGIRYIQIDWEVNFKRKTTLQWTWKVTKYLDEEIFASVRRKSKQLLEVYGIRNEEVHWQDQLWFGVTQIGCSEKV